MNYWFRLVLLDYVIQVIDTPTHMMLLGVIQGFSGDACVVSAPGVARLRKGS